MIPLGVVAVAGAAFLSAYLLSDIERLCEGGANDCTTVAELRRGNPYDDAIALYDRRDSSLALVGGRARRFVPVREMPPLVRRAWVAVEDRRFRTHGGVDALGILRASVTNLSAAGVESGASTIPMQLVRVVWEDRVWKMNRWRRKLIEVRTAPRLVDELGHDRVLELYLNGLYLGAGVYGVSAASRHYFGLPLDDLRPEHVALLVAITRTPGRYEPRENPNRALARRNLVLGEMYEADLLTAADLRRAREAPLGVSAESKLHRERTYATAAVRRELRRVAPVIGGRSSVRVFTTIDQHMQAESQSRVSAFLDALAEGEFGNVASPGVQPEAGLVVLEAGSGAIRAVVGGHDFADTELDRALQTRRQVGSLAKPLLVASYLERGGRASTPVSTRAIELESPAGPWRPGDHVEAGSLLPWEIIAQSSNRGAIRIGRRVGVDVFADDLKRFGVSGPIPEWPSAFLGAFEASVVEMSGAYAVIENGGVFAEPHLIRRVEDHQGRVLYAHDGGLRRGRRVTTPNTAYIVKRALEDAVASGTGWRAAAESDGQRFSGKTGTSNDGRDAWFVGSATGLTAGVWVGHDLPRPITENGGGGTLAAPLWATVMTGLARPDAGRSGSFDALMDPPYGVRRIAVDRRTGREFPVECATGSVPHFSEVWVRTALSRLGPVRSRRASATDPSRSSSVQSPHRDSSSACGRRLDWRTPEPTLDVLRGFDLKPLSTLDSNRDTLLAKGGGN